MILQIPTTAQMTAREKRIKQLTERINKLVEEVCRFVLINGDIFVLSFFAFKTYFDENYFSFVIYTY